ncbi:MAG: peptidylprolyl isomerase [Gammaproteobacteria bacterium]|nr:peptidylprolyl isomerase [Gammaproteobacteria bacterium]
MQPLMYYQFDYAIKNDEGTIVDSSEGGEPLTFIQGDGRVVKGVEDALRGREVGDKFSVSIEPEDAYGWPQRSLIRTLGSDMFDFDIDAIEEGMLFQVGTGSEAEVVKVMGVGEDEITIDGNHPLAGLTLNFDIKVIVAREATPEEIEWMAVKKGDGGNIF